LSFSGTSYTSLFPHSLSQDQVDGLYFFITQIQLHNSALCLIDNVKMSLIHTLIAKGTTVLAEHSTSHGAFKQCKSATGSTLYLAIPLAYACMVSDIS
jgi:hypothetical protein